MKQLSLDEYTQYLMSYLNDLEQETSKRISKVLTTPCSEALEQHLLQESRKELNHQIALAQIGLCKIQK
jgi:hypothetical protein